MLLPESHLDRFHILTFMHSHMDAVHVLRYERSLLRACASIRSNRVPDTEEMILNRLGFIFLAYRVEYWWWESIEMCRKFCMTTLVLLCTVRMFAKEGSGAE